MRTYGCKGRERKPVGRRLEPKRQESQRCEAPPTATSRKVFALSLLSRARANLLVTNRCRSNRGSDKRVPLAPPKDWKTGSAVQFLQGGGVWWHPVPQAPLTLRTNR